MAQTNSRTEETIASYIAENILFRKNGYPYAADDSFLENGIIDSVNVLELVMFVEEKFKLHVEDSEIVPENFDSVAKLAAYIDGKGGVTQKETAEGPSTMGGTSVLNSKPGMV